MKKTFFVLTLLFSFGAYVIYEKFGVQPKTIPDSPVPTLPTVPSGTSPTTPSQPTQPKQVACTQEAKLCPDGSAVGRVGPSCEFAPCPVVPVAAKRTYKDGSFTGAVADAYYGNVQVKVVVSNGKITSVTFLDYPKDRQHSAELSAYATPILSQEAITAQNANVDIVSGATATSEAFIQSLTDALAQAKA